MSGIKRFYAISGFVGRLLIAALVHMATLPQAHADGAHGVLSGASSGTSTASLNSSVLSGSSPSTSSGNLLGTGDSSASISALQKASELVPALQVSGRLLVDTSRTLDQNNEPSWSGLYIATLSMKHTSTGITGFIEAGYAREYSYERDDGTDGDLHHLSLGVGKKWASGKDFNSSVIDHVGISATGVLPGSREAQRRTFQGSGGPALSLDKKLGAGFTLGQMLSYSRASYEYDIRSDGTVNNPDVYRSRTDLSYDFNDKWSFVVIYLYTYAVSYQSVGRAGDTYIYELDYQPMKNLGFGLGVLSDRSSTLDPDGQSSQVSIYTEEGASAYFDVILSF